MSLMAVTNKYFVLYITGDPRHTSTQRRSTESNITEYRHAAREKLEELLANHPYEEVVRTELTDEDDELLLIPRDTRDISRQTKPETKLRSPNKKRSALTVCNY